MSNYATEEEQIAALKKWWNDNGNSLLIGIGAALMIVFGWKAYQNSVIQEKSAASLKYQQLVTVATQDITTSEDEANTVSYIAEQLKADYAGTEYAVYAALFIAKEQVAGKDYESALDQLKWVLANTQDVRLTHIVNARIARILAAQDKTEEALAKLVATEDAFKANYLELTGDIKRRAGDEKGALDAYKSAYELVKDEPQAQPLLAVKLSDMGVNPEAL